MIVDVADAASRSRQTTSFEKKKGRVQRQMEQADLSRKVRKLLDEAGLEEVKIFTSGGFDECKIAKCLAEGARIDAFGVGTKVGVSAAAPYLDIAYKRVKYDGRPVLKLSSGKKTLVEEKQVLRVRRTRRWLKKSSGRAGGSKGGFPALPRRLAGALQPRREEVVDFGQALFGDLHFFFVFDQPEQSPVDQRDDAPGDDIPRKIGKSVIDEADVERPALLHTFHLMAHQVKNVFPEVLKFHRYHPIGSRTKQKCPVAAIHGSNPLPSRCRPFRNT